MKTYTPTAMRKDIFKIMNKDNQSVRISMANKYHDDKHDWLFVPMKELKSFYVWQERKGLHHLIHKAEKMKPESEKDFKHDVGL